jgi:raffinose/stachyose/melibiose transport system substrate-binding protein
MNLINTSRRGLTTGIALVAVGSLALAGCSGGSSEPATNADGQIVLNFASWIPTSDQWPEMIAMFEEENPDITIEYTPEADYAPYITALDNSILAGETPDVFGIQPGASFADYADYAMNTEDYASGFVDGVQQSALDQTSTDDGVMAVPILTAGSEFFLYNQTLMTELGLELPTDYDSLVAMSQTARAAGYSPFAMGAADAWHDNDFFVWLSNQYGDGGDVYKAADGELPWDSDNLVEAATVWQSLFSDGVFQDAATTTTTYPSARDDFFLARKSIAMPTGSWHVGATLDSNTEVPGSAVENDDLGMAPFPMIGDNDTGSTTGVDFALAVSADIDDAKVDAAAKFVEFMAVGNGQQWWVNTLQGFPVATDIQVEIGADEPDLGKQSVEAVTEALADATFPRKVISEDNASLETDLGVVLQNIAGGAAPASELASLNG